MWIIGAVIQILIAGVIFGFILQIAAKIIVKEGIDFGDAFKTAIVATAGNLAQRWSSLTISACIVHSCTVTQQCDFFRCSSFGGGRSVEAAQKSPLAASCGSNGRTLTTTRAPAPKSLSEFSLS